MRPVVRYPLSVVREDGARGAGRAARGSLSGVRGQTSAARIPATPQPEGEGRTSPRSGSRGAGGMVIFALLVVAAAAGAQEPAKAAGPETRFKEATQLLQAGDVPGAVAVYRDLAASGSESGSLYWNWAQAASSRGALGEALWALLRAREIGGADSASLREIDRLRQAANLDTAELAPSPLLAVARAARHAHLDLVAVVLLLLSLAGHALARTFPAARWPVGVAWLSFAFGIGCATVALIGARAHPTAVVVHRGIPLADAASPSATVLATLREGEVVPVLGESGAYMRIQDSSGARGWVTAADVWRLDRPPAQ